MAAADYFSAVQKIYIAYYQRPADPAGLLYWAGRVEAAGGDTSTVINAFATSAEATNLYGDIDEDGVGGVIDKIYQALFGRIPDLAGKAFYVKAFGDGSVSAGNIAVAILNAARGEDNTAIANKVWVANTYTQVIAGRDLDDPAFGTDKTYPFDYAGDAAASAARQLLAKVTSDPKSLLDTDGVRSELEGPKTGGGGSAPSIPTFSVDAASGLDLQPGKYKLADSLEKLLNADQGLLTNALSYRLADQGGNLGTLTAQEIAIVKGAANHNLYTYGEFFTLKELIGTAGDDVFTAPAGSLQTHKLIDGAGGHDILNIVASGNLSNVAPGSLEIRNIETIVFQNASNVWGNINAGWFEEGTAIWQQAFDVDVINLEDGQTAGFSGTDGNVLISYSAEAESASVVIEDLASAAGGNSFVISGTNLTALSMSGSMAEQGGTLRLYAETGSGLTYTPTENIQTLNLAVTTDIELDLTGNFTSLTTLDASKSTGGISLTLFAQPAGLLQSGKISLGDGSDHLHFQSHSASHLGNILPSAGSTGNIEDDFEDLMLSITDFDGEHDVLHFWPDFLQGDRHVLSLSEQNAISGAGSLFDAILVADEATRTSDTVSDGSVVPQWTTFQYNGSTYIYQNNGDAAFDYPAAIGDADGLIQLVGFTGALTEDNFDVVQYVPV